MTTSDTDDGKEPENLSPEAGPGQRDRDTATDDWTEEAGALIAESPWTATLSALGLGLAAGILIGILIARD